MSTVQTKTTPDPRAEKAFFDVEGEISDLFHMAQIAWNLLMGVKATTSASGVGSELDILPWEFEQIQFAVGHTMELASDLEKAFKREFEAETAHDHDP
jgi:hypothetical protein